MEHLGHKPVPKWDAGVTRRGCNCYLCDMAGPVLANFKIILLTSLNNLITICFIWSLCGLF